MMFARRLASFFRSRSLSPPNAGLVPELPPPPPASGARSIGLFPYLWTRTS